MLEALDQDADLLVHVKRHRAHHPLHPAHGEPLRRGVDEHAPDLGVVDRVEEPEEPGLVIPQPQMLAIDLRRAAPDEAVALPGGEERDLGPLEEGVLLRVEAFLHVEIERGNPGGIAAEDFVGRANEGGDPRAGDVLADGDRHPAFGL